MKIEKLKNTVAPIIGIYGEPGVGKTTLASKFVKSIWMAVERGIPAGVVVDVIDGLLTFANCAARVVQGPARLPNIGY
jgi:putative protein kinase ArgK-like GTPase of G3E family